MKEWLRANTPMANLGFARNREPAASLKTSEMLRDDLPKFTVVLFPIVSVFPQFVSINKHYERL